MSQELHSPNVVQQYSLKGKVAIGKKKDENINILKTHFFKWLFNLIISI